jgi:lipoprotein-anchoring transpeptidase ErfK/SrfK
LLAIGGPARNLLLYCLFPAPSSTQIAAKNLRVSPGDFALRSSISVVVIAFALAGSIGAAAAQYYPAPPPSYSSAPPQAVQPYSPQPYSPYGQPPASTVSRDDGRYAPYPARTAGQYDGLPPQPLPPAANGAPFQRPPADVSALPLPDGDVTGTVRTPTYPAPTAGAAPSPSRPAVVAGLPPDEQPEFGPRKELPPQFRRQVVDYLTKEPAGTIIIDTPHTYLYLVLGNGTAMRYGIGVGREGFTWAGAERVSRMKEWPDWFPPKEMIERQPYLPRFMAGGDTNPLGARAMYLGNTLYRIHGTNQPSTIGTFVSSGCIRLTNEDVADLYSRVNVGTRVVVLPGAGGQPSASAQTTITR